MEYIHIYTSTKKAYLTQVKNFETHTRFIQRIDYAACDLRTRLHADLFQRQTGHQRVEWRLGCIECSIRYSVTAIKSIYTMR